MSVFPRFDRHESDAPYFRMFEQWPCNTFKPHSHLLADSSQMYVTGKGPVAGLRGAVLARKSGKPWIVSLNDGARWEYATTSEMMEDWEIVREWDHVSAIRKERKYQ